MAANISEDQLHSISRDDIRDLFPGPEHFFRRKAIWLKIHVEDRGEEGPTAMAGPSTAQCDATSPGKFLKFSSIEYVIFTDSELEQARRLYFEKQRLGKELEVSLSKELFCRLIRNTMTNMIAIARASEEFRYPSKHEVISMAKRLVEYYPMIKDKSSDNVWENVSRKLMKRLSNVKSPVKSKGPPVKVQRRNEDADDSSDWDSSASTVILERSPASTSTPKRLTDNNDEPSTGSGDLLDSEKSQARHYRTLQDMYKSKKPNKAAVSHLLDLEFQSRRQFIVSDTLKEQDRPGKILDAYPCFRELDHIMDELRRIINPDNPDYIANIKDRWETFYGKVQFYGVMRKFMKPPKTLDGVEHATAVFSALPQLFQSPAMAPKKTRTPSEVFFHILTSCESPDSFLLTRSHPIVLLGQENCLLSIGPTTLCSFPKIKFHEAILYLMGCYYVFHLTYPKCIATLLSVIQTEVLGDGLHERDITPSYKRAIADWKAFID